MAVGKIMNVDAIVVGSISVLTNAAEADTRILNVETGETIVESNRGGASISAAADTSASSGLKK